MTRAGAPVDAKDLPDEVPVFPLPGALLLPGGTLPLNLFEPRYLNMANDALAGDRWIGMVQPRGAVGHPVPDGAEVYDVGCLGRVGSFKNTEDGRILVVLEGVSRFRIARELDGRNGYRRVRPDYAGFAADLTDDAGGTADRARLVAAAEAFFARHDQEIDLAAAAKVSDDALVNVLCLAAPFSVAEKQALLECAGTAARGELLCQLMEMAARAADAPASDVKH